MKEPTIRVPNWSELQHYKDRSPPWIKLHRKLLDNRQWHSLSGDAAKLLIELWLVASDTEDGTIAIGTEDLAWKLRREPGRLAKLLVELELRGFVDLSVHDASTVLAPCSPEVERETEVEVEVEKEEKVSGATHPPAVSPAKPDPVEWMHALWQEVLGSSRALDLTPARRQKYLAMYNEQLADSPDPMIAWRAVLLTLSRSEWHMGKREYQLPESFLRSPERRSQWVEKALEFAKTGGVQSKQQQNVIRIQEHFRRNRA